MTQGATDAAEAEDVPPMFPLGSSDRPGDENGPLSGPSLSGRSARGAHAAAATTIATGKRWWRENVMQADLSNCDGVTGRAEFSYGRDPARLN
jgi:hypothetical protein